MDASKVRIENETLSAVVVLALTLVTLYLIGSIAHPFLLGIGDPPGQHSHSKAPTNQVEAKDES